MKRIYLITPGPSAVPSFIREALSKELIHHRTEEFRQILKEVCVGLKDIFCTKNPVVIFSSSGTGAMEAGVANFFSPQDKVLVINGGKFGERWRDIAKIYNLQVIELKLEEGCAPLISEVKAILDKEKDIKGVLTTLCETSTATVYDIEGMGKILKDKNAILIVDAISGLGQDKLLSDEWGVDVVVSASQKGLMLPPGLGFLSISEKAKDFLKNSKLPRYYFDLNKALKSYEKDDTPFTPSVSLIVGLEKAIKVIKEEGLEKRWEKFAKLSMATREAAKTLGLEIFSKSPSSSVTAIVSPSNIKASELVKKLRKDWGLSIAAGQDELKDKIFRIAHMGWVNQDDLIVCFSLLEKALRDLGYSFKLGSSLQRFQEVFYG
ncbi:MAG: alanine--glyoxylate aminotransferase family protein [Candidatus Omnitrophica bacterium]|nr:alanine--glyoxylate aminotransferase family protein [Candidatus Omnitrophota bacterium]MCM8824033.1 alanine--glyoxylate aminotransferase family protein [Candidatus Omnitrophota bacterium]MCM8826079.1 alanine--glyoxylate aminotransferase family protein [Candidatus Omnitrophota bacterium]